MARKTRSAADQRLLGLAVAVLVALGATLVIGLSFVPLPYPAHRFVALEVPNDVYPWKPSPLTGVYEPNEKLKQAVRLFEGQVVGSESLAFGPDGQLVTLDIYGDVRRALPSADARGGYDLQPQPTARLAGGRPLGARFDHEGNLYVCHTHKGLLFLPQGAPPVMVATHISPTSELHPGAEISLANDLDIASDGKVYFTASSDILPPLSRHGFWDLARAWQLDLIRGASAGLLLEYDPSTGATIVIADGLRFANGVALSSDGSFAVVAETNHLCLTRVWLKGPKAGTRETLIDRLPGPPDGVSRASDGGFYVSIVAAAPPPMASKAVRSPLLRTLVAWITDYVQPHVDFMGMVVKVATNGSVAEVWTDTTSEFLAAVSSAEEHSGRLWLGNLVGNHISYIELDTVHVGTPDVSESDSVLEIPPSLDATA